MATPIITTAGAAGGLLKITDQDARVLRVPLASVSQYGDTSNSNTFRLDIEAGREIVSLVYSTQTQVNDALATLDALF